jgi:hypothetical protein
MRLVERLRGLSPHWLVEVFATSNIAFLAADIYLAHLENNFARTAEWLPVFFSCLAPLVLVGGLSSGRYQRGVCRVAGYVVGIAAVLVGIAGMLLHLQSAFFELRTLKSLVYTAPFVAPLSYVGVGLLLILNRMESRSSPDFGAWVLFLATGGFVGNFVLSLLDHAQNGFFSPLEWVPVVAAAFGLAFFSTALLRRGRALLRLSLGIAALQAVVGLSGFALHLAANLAKPGVPFRDRLIYGAPVFAPLLFADLAALAALGLWQMLGVAARAAAPPSPASAPDGAPAL